MPRKSSVPIPLAETFASHIRPPADLTGDARKAFVDVVINSTAGHFQNSDIDRLCIYSRAIVLERTASAGLKADGYVTADGKVSPWLAHLTAATRIISTYSRMLRLNPTARSKPATEPEPISYYARQNLLEARDDEPN